MHQNFSINIADSHKIRILSILLNNLVRTVFLVIKMNRKLLFGIIAILALFGIAVLSGVHASTGVTLLDDSSSNGQTQDDPPLDYDYAVIFHTQLLDDPPLDYDYA